MRNIFFFWSWLVHFVKQINIYCGHNRVNGWRQNFVLCCFMIWLLCHLSCHKRSNIFLFLSILDFFKVDQSFIKFYLPIGSIFPLSLSLPLTGDNFYFLLELLRLMPCFLLIYLNNLRNYQGGASLSS